MTLPATLAPYALAVAALGCYDIDALRMPGPLVTPAVDGKAVPVADYITLLLLDGSAVLVSTTGGVHDPAEQCPGTEPHVAWLTRSASASAVQFPSSALIDTDDARVDVSRVCALVAESCTAFPPCVGLTDEFVVSREHPCVKGANVGPVFAFYSWSGAAWVPLARADADAIRCHAALEFRAN